MGYGTLKQNEMAVTPKSGDEGIDGIVSADKFGFDSIYIQAKSGVRIARSADRRYRNSWVRWQGRAQQKVFLSQRRTFQKRRLPLRKTAPSEIVLVDGNQLTELMIEYNLGVSVVETYVVKRVDYDFFNDEL